MTPTRSLGQAEFVALVAMLSATVALSTDAMLPAMPDIAAELSPDAPNRAQLIISSFVLGMGLGTFFTGPLSDRYGRKPVIVIGAIFYCLFCLAAYLAPTLELMLASRVFMGICAAASRVVSVALVRDLYEGRQMARLMSFVLIVFTIVPAAAPSIGALVIAVADWRSIFLAFTVFCLISTVWFMIRQPETLNPKDKRPFDVANLWAATKEVFAHPTSRLSLFVQTPCFAILLVTLSSTQPVFDQAYGQGENFHLWFAGVALLASTSGFLNAHLVERIGMRPIIKAVLGAQIVLSVIMACVVLLDVAPTIGVWIYAGWVTSLFVLASLTLGNLNALAMEPMGHIAGSAASVVSAVSTIGGVVIAVPISLAFDGTAMPMAIGVFLCAILGYYLTTKIRRETDG